jgi:hypothetical protein
MATTSVSHPLARLSFTTGGSHRKMLDQIFLIFDVNDKRINRQSKVVNASKSGCRELASVGG